MTKRAIKIRNRKWAPGDIEALNQSGEDCALRIHVDRRHDPGKRSQLAIQAARQAARKALDARAPGHNGQTPSTGTVLGASFKRGGFIMGETRWDRPLLRLIDGHPEQTERVRPWR